jgi:FixJ family two-component response regulator
MSTEEIFLDTHDGNGDRVERVVIGRVPSGATDRIRKPFNFDEAINLIQTANSTDVVEITIQGVDRQGDNKVIMVKALITELKFGTLPK